MAIGTTAALLGSAAIGAGASMIGAREQSDAISDAQRAQDQASARAIDFQRETRDIQLGLAEPFRRFGVQQANFLSELFGGEQFSADPQQGIAGVTTPSSGPNYDAYLGANNDVNAWAQTLNPRDQAYIAQQGYGANGDGMIQGNEAAAYHYNTHGQGEGRALPTYQPNMAANDAASGAVPGAVNTNAQATARQRFDGSLFNDALQGQLARAATGIDANLSASGDVYSGARQQAQQNTAADLGMNALGMYVNTMMGQPSTAGAQMASSAAGNFGANAGNIAMQEGQNAANSAYAQGDVTSGLASGLAGLASFGLGNFSRPGGTMPKAGFKG